MSRKSILTLAAITALGTSFLAPVDAFAHGSFGRAAGGHSSMGTSHVGSAPSMGHVGHMSSLGEGNRRNGEAFRYEHRPFWHHPFWHRDYEHYEHPFWHRDYGRWFGYGRGVYGGIETAQVGGGYSVGGSYQPSSGGTAAAPAAPCNCLTKQYLPDGSVLFQDICTREAATMPAAQQANGQAPR
jgi:hypothetical protein